MRGQIQKYLACASHVDAFWDTTIPWYQQFMSLEFDKDIVLHIALIVG